MQPDLVFWRLAALLARYRSIVDMRLARALPADKIPASSCKCYLFPSPYWQWVVRFLKFHGHGGEWRHPRVLPASAVAEFLADLSVRLKVAAATQNQALNALVFLYDVFLPRGDYPTRRGASRARPGAGIIGRKIICNGR